MLIRFCLIKWICNETLRLCSALVDVSQCFCPSNPCVRIDGLHFPCEKAYVLLFWDLCHLIIADAGESNLCLGCFIFILSSPDIHRMIEVKKRGVHAVVISFPVVFLIKKIVFAFAEKNSYLHKFKSNSLHIDEVPIKQKSLLSILLCLVHPSF